MLPRIIFIVLLLWICFSCNRGNNIKEKNIIIQWENKEIIFPDSLNFVIFGKQNTKHLIHQSEYKDTFTYPVCLDEKDDFNALNRFPGEMTFQSFLLNRENKVIAIGNPVHNPKVKELYLQRLTNGEMPSSSVAMTDVSVNTANMDFGTFPQSERQEYKFVLTNEGNNLLVIQDVTTSCGCTKVSYSKEPF